MLRDGRTVATKVAMPLGSIAAPFAMAQYWGKFEGCVAGLLAAADAAALRVALEGFPGLASVGAVMGRLKGPFQ